MRQPILERYRYSLILLRQLVITDFKLRYQGSVLGYVWSLLRPLFLFAILYVVFVYFLPVGKDIPHYPVYLLLGIVVWNFFNEVTVNGVKAIVERGDLIRKINFPKYVIILATAFSALINLFLNLIVVLIFMFFNGVDVTSAALLAPIFIIEIFIFSLALAFLLSALFVRIRDINYIWEVVMQALFYATPIIYPLTLVSDKWPEVAKFILLNPVAQVIQDLRAVLVTPKTVTMLSFGLSWYAVVIGIVVVTVIGAIIYFKRRSPHFAEEV